ncbi:MAG: cellulase family glycosylhydrolase [Anaerolineae bacterium]|nr:cellulase family glycosylhydrolase [Anaerolineae bacterium]
MQSSNAESPDRRKQKVILSGLVLIVTLALAGGIWVVRNNGGQPTVFIATPTPFIPRDLAPEAVTNPPFPSLTYGIHTFLWWNETTRTYDLDMVRLMNFTHVKQRFSWEDVQPAPDTWEFERADDVVAEVAHRHLNVVARLDGPPDWALAPASNDPTAPPIDVDAWATYCGVLADRYKGRIAGYQIWNEPNLSREWGSRPPNAVGYVRLLQPCAQAIREADPDAVIISAGLAPTGTGLPDAIPDMDYLRQMYDAGAAPWFDVLGLNAPGYDAAPTMSPDMAAEVYGHRWMCFRHVEDLRGIMVAKGDAAKQVALLEVGWTLDPREDSPYHWHAVEDEQQQAEYLVGAYRYAAEHWRPWLGLMVTIYMSDIEWTEDDEEYWWAVNTPGYPPTFRQAYFELANMEKIMGDMLIPARDPGDPDATTVDPIQPREDGE